MKALIFNEIVKLIKGKLLIIAIGLAILFSIFAVFQQSDYLKEVRDKHPKMIEKYIQSTEEKLRDPTLTEEQSKVYNHVLESYKIMKEANQKKHDAFQEENQKTECLEAQRLEEDYLKKNGIEPEDIYTINAYTILLRVLVSSEFIIIFLIVALLGGGIVSNEYQPATIKMLVTRTIPRWKILASKYITLLISTTFIALIALVVTFVWSGLQFGWGEANYPISLGAQFMFDGNPIAIFKEGSIHIISRWIFTTAASAHTVFVCIVTATLAFAISSIITRKVLSLIISFMGVIGIYLLSMIFDVRSSVGIVNFMSYFALDPIWTGGLLSKAMNGNITVSFAEGILTIWLFVTLAVSFIVFTRRDVVA